ncbi:MATE family efflux transporter [Conchiformibius kuhniae]|uniref:Multidrug-efflux transporter n=1 Tax=Conchiformibius kuhniae TaxID=211502 RepID=A0ABD8B6Z7_9NEIS|nr:MATE family efflux transporter [Conchiformibius kuhniae]
MWFDLNRYSRRAFAKEARRLLQLALPMMSAQIAAVGVGVVDTAMAGGAGKNDLTAVALGASVFVTVFVTFLGVMNALNPIIAQLYGAGKREAVGETGRQGLWFGAILGMAGMLSVMLLIAPLQRYLDMHADVETMLGDYLFYVALALPAAMLYRALYAYASSLGKTQAIMWISWAALLLNIPFNYIFVYGKLGIAAMGGAGCGLATALVFWFNAAALGAYVAKNRFFAPFGLTARFSRPDPAVLKHIWQLGWPIGLSYFLEVSLFSFVVWLIADLGADTVAAQQITLNIGSITYMIPSAIGAAATVRVGYCVGLRQFARAKYVSGVALLLSAASALLCMLLLILFRDFWAQRYTNDTDVLAIAGQLLILCAVMQLFDFTQCVASYALRGYKITRLPMLIHAITFWGLGLLPGYWLAYGAPAMGIYGFWTALLLSLGTAAALLIGYLHRCSTWLARSPRHC